MSNISPIGAAEEVGPIFLNRKGLSYDVELLRGF
jgi:hypothetical protein